MITKKRFAVVTEEYRLKERVNGDRQEPGPVGWVCVFSFMILEAFTWQRGGVIQTHFTW